MDSRCVTITRSSNTHLSTSPSSTGRSTGRSIDRSIRQPTSQTTTHNRQPITIMIMSVRSVSPTFPSQWWRLCLCLCFGCWLCALPIAHASTSTTLDLSYKPYLDGSTMAHIVTDTVGMNRPHHVTLDLSFSSLGNDGMEKVMSSLLESQRQSGSATDHGETEATLRLSLTSRMNGLTPTAVSMILQNIMNQQSDTSATPNGGDGVVVESATTPDDQAKKESQDGESTNSTDTTSTTTTTTTKVPKLRCGVLDLGWNNFAPDQPGARRMFANLRKLVEERDACPTVLRLDRCGLGPAACRSIGKGIMNRYAKSKTDAADTTLPPTPPLSLYLCGNTDIGDGGVAAIAAGLGCCCYCFC